MTIKQITLHIRRLNFINGIEDNVNHAAEQVAIVANELFKEYINKDEHECLNDAYYLYLRSMDSIKWANKFNEILHHASKRIHKPDDSPHTKMHTIP